MQIAPVVDASSSQSRTDVLGIGMSAVLILTGLQWLSLKPKTQLPVCNCKPIWYLFVAGSCPRAQLAHH